MDEGHLPATSLYLDLLKRTLTNHVYVDRELETVHPRSRLKRWLCERLRTRGFLVVRPGRYDAERRRTGRDWPQAAHTMIGLERLDHLQQCMESVLEDGVPGDFMETGVWRGGAAIFMRAFLKVHGVTDRVVWAADSFAGLPPPDPARYPLDAGSELHRYEDLAIPLEEVLRNFERYGLLDDQVRFLPGWFRDTLPSAPVERVAVLRLDGDMYESTMDALRHVYAKVSPGGWVIVDDYGAVEACRCAVHDFRDREGIRDELRTVGWTAAAWRRSG